MALTAIPASTVIRFTDNEWNGQSIGAGGIFNTGEGFVQWTAPVEGVTAGTVVIIGSASDVGLITSTTDGSTAIGTVTGTLNLNAADETLYAYQGTELRASGFLSVIATHTADSVLETGLSGSQLIYLTADVDIAAYVGSRSGQTAFSGYLALIADTGNIANWVSQDTAANDSFDGNAPDVPFDGSIFTTALGGNTFATWIASYPAVGLLTGPNDDFDNDGLDNVVENILGSNPAISNVGLTTVSGTATSVTFRHDRADSPATDLTPIYEWSTDLATWYPSGVGGSVTVTIGAPAVITNGSPNDLVEVTASVTSGTASTLFVRLKVTNP